MTSRKRLALTLLVALGGAAVVLARPAVHSPLAGLRRPTANEARYDATVREQLRAGAYTYVHLELDSGAHTWAVTTERPALGARVHVEVFGLSDRFESPRLGRVFTPLSFASIHPTKESP